MTDFNTNVRSVEETCDVMGLAHLKRIYELKESPIIKPKLVWIIGFEKPKRDVDDRERQRISEGFANIYRISGERLIDPTQPGYSFISKEYYQF